jgi:hypothetical protein
VDERGDGRRALHRVGQPDLQRQLGGLADAPQNSSSGISRAVDMVPVERGEVDRAVGPVAHDDAEQETEVADAVDDEGLLRRVGRGLLLVTSG